MRRILLFSVLVFTIALLASCSTERTLSPEPESPQQLAEVDREQAAAEILKLAGWPIEETEALPQPDTDKCLDLIVDYSREVVAEGIVHYRWEIRIGFDEMEVIALHRVVKEDCPEHPIRTRKAVFLQHGDAKDFRGMFMPGTLSATTPDDFGAAIYWARRDVDVWGIDQAWNLVPAETTDFGFMAGWGIDKQYRDLGTGVAIARLARLATGNGYDQMILLGYSSGSATGYALVNAETQLSAGLRQVGGWIPVDYSPVTDDEDWNTIQACDFIPEFENYMDNGEYGYFVGFDFLGLLARDDPDGGSPVFPGFTNLQAAMYVAAGPIFDVDAIHYLAGVWEDGLPVDLIHTTIPEWLDFMIAGAPWEPVKFMLDYYLWGCPEVDSPWDDHFADITIPVLNVAAAGGIGPLTGYCLGLLGSTDITDMNVQLMPDEEALFDYGHVDLWIANNAPELVWEPILEWVVAHSKGPGHKPVVAHCD